MDIEQRAISRLQEASKMSLTYYEEPLLITISGGKDSATVLELAKRAGIPYELQHSLTTADAPETVRYVQKVFQKEELAGVKCEIRYPIYKGKRTSMWRLIEEKMVLPTRIHRYCCEILKESGGKGRLIATGVRWDESVSRLTGRGKIETIARKKEDKVIVKTPGENENQETFDGVIMLNNDNDSRRMVVERCAIKGKVVYNPIIDWATREVWSFLTDAKTELNHLYDCGFSRVGCIGCPIAGLKRWNEFWMFPGYQEMYIHAFERMIIRRKAAGKETVWKTGYDAFLWWMEDKNVSGQMTFDDLEEEADGL